MRVFFTLARYAIERFPTATPGAGPLAVTRTLAPGPWTLVLLLRFCNTHTYSE